MWEVKQASSLVFDEWGTTSLEEKCENCDNYDGGDYEVFGICKVDNQIRRYIDQCGKRGAFVKRKGEKPKPPSFFRPKIDCHCGNCAFLKQREGLLSCVNIESKNYLKAMGTSGTCVKWVDLQLKHKYEDYAHYLPEKEFPFASRLKAVREYRKLSVEQVCDKLGIPVTQWNDYESAMSVMSIDELVRFADYSNVDVYFLLGREYKQKIID